MKKNSWPLTALFAALLLVAAACGATESTESAAGDDTADGETTDEALSDDEMTDGDMADGEHGGDHGDGDDHGGEHGHGHGEPIEVPDGMAVPTISISAEPDTVSGHNLFVELDDFDIAPENASTDAVDGEGHLHLYVNGERVMRFYNTAIHLTGLPAGEHEVMVEISANNHSAYAVDGEPIRAMTTVTVEATDGDGHGHGHGDDAELVEPTGDLGVELAVTEDPKSGWNVEVVTTGLELAPASVGGDHVDGEGHLHLHVDGEKLTRLYGNHWHLSGLKAGTHEIMVEASTNDHRAYGIDGEAVRASVEIEVVESDDDKSHGDDDMAAMEDGEDAGHHGDEDGDEHGHGSHHGTGEMLDIGAAEADTVIELTIAGDEVEVSDRRIDVDEGSTVGIIVTSDLEEQIHVHGYDLLADIGPASPTGFAFLADSQGVFEVELEQSGRFLFEIVVR